MTESATTANQGATSSALLIDGDAFDRLGPVLRHLVVGLVDQSIQVRLISSDPRVESLQLGPVKTLFHHRITWPLGRRRTEEILLSISQDVPTLVHAVASDSYRLARSIAEAFDTETVLQVSSVADCHAVAQWDMNHVGRLVALSRSLVTVLEQQLSFPSDRIELIPPGVSAIREPTCFSRSERLPTILCTAPFELEGNVERLIGAVDLLRRRGREFLLFLLGQGTRETALRQMVRRRQLSAHVIFAQPMGDAAQAMKSADIFVDPAQYTAFRVDGLQAMGAGTAVVAVANALTDFYRHEETALVCADPMEEALAGAVERLLIDREAARRLAASAIEYVREHHAMSTMAERTAAMYRTLALHRTTFSIKE